LPIKRGDRLLMTIKGVSEPVVALLDEVDGSVMVRQRNGVTGRRSIKNLRLDAAQPATSPATTVVEDRPDLSNVSAVCPMCREPSATAKLAGSDRNLRIFRVRFVCSQGHEWEVELPHSRWDS
jgi:hypothetical protein